MAFVFYDVFSMLCHRKGISESKAAEKVDLNRSAVVKWKRGATPETSSIQKLATLFGVTTDYILGTSECAQLEVAEYTAHRNLKLWEAKLDFAETDSDRKEAETEIAKLKAECKKLATKIAEKNKALTPKSERGISDEDIMFALWGDTSDISEEDLADVKRYAAFIRERKRKND